MTVEKARAALAKLEDLGGAGFIATYFRNQGITGYRDSACRCPIACYLNRETEGAWMVYTDSAYPDIIIYDAEKEIELGEFARAFIRDFDSGNYPEIDALPGCAARHE